MSEPTPPTHKRFLLFDGGPSEFVTVRILREMERQHPGFLERTDVFAGTSDGGFTSLFMSHSLQQGRNGLETLEGCVAFLDDLAQAFKVGAGNILRLATGLRSLYSGDRLRETLSRYFGDTRMGELTRRPVWLTALNVNDGTPLRMRHERYNELRLVDAACGAAAFPLLFPLYTFWGYTPNAGDLVADGGFVDNSTLVTTLAHQLDDAGPEPEPRARSLVEMMMLSLGSRQQKTLWNPCPPRYPETRYQYGWIWWLVTGLRNALMLLDAGAAKEYDLMHALLGKNGFRFEHRLSELKLMSLAMLDPKKLSAKTETIAQQEWGSPDCVALRAWVKRVWMV